MDNNFYKNDEESASKKYVPTPIYPDISFSFKAMKMNIGGSPADMVFTYEIRTLLRVKHEGVWYGWKIMDTGIMPPQSSQEMADALISSFLSRFHCNIYLAQMYGKVDPNLMTRDIKGNMVPVFQPLGDQREERERLKEAFRLPI